MMFKPLLFGSLAALALTGAASASVPDPSGADTNRTNRSTYAPVTALDMVRRIPGFAIQSDDSGNRGFGQARGNVLINGQRVSAKANGADAALGRIAAARVVRVEVLDGTQTDIPGLSGRVVNVITDGEGTMDGTWRCKIRIRENLPPSLNECRVTLAGSQGVLSWSVEVDSAPQRNGDAGWRLIEDGQGALLEQRREDFTRLIDDVSLSGSLAWKPSNGVIANLNGKIGVWEMDGKQISRTYPLGGPLVPVMLDLSNTRVEERRGEMILTHGCQLSPKLNLQLSGGVEYSELEQTGDAENKRAFTRPKGFANLSWQQSGTLKLVGKVERRVGQLDFYDFISSVDLDLGNGQSGNQEIVPSQSWRYSLEAQKDLKDWGAATVRLLYVDLADVVDQVPIGQGAGPGNIDSATAWAVETESTLKLSKLGFAGAELTAQGRYYDTQADDPVTGITRSINGHLIWDYNIDLRQDVPSTDIAWGMVLEGFKQEPFYQLSDTQLSGNEPPFLMAYLEHKDIAGITGTVAIGNLTNQKDTYWRRVYDGDRNGALTRTEKYSRAFGPIFTVELKGKF